MEDERPARRSAFGNLLRRYRLEASLSQQALAELARMSARGIGALERGDRRTPQRDTLVLLADALALEGQRRREFEAAANPSGSRRVGGSVATGPWPAAPLSNLPLSLTSFVGRERELAEVTELLREHRLITLSGAGGIGKTRTALEVAGASSGTAGDAVRLVELASLADASRVVATIASSVGMQETPNRSLLEVLQTFLERKQLLLVLDNCEHVIDEVRSVALTLLQHCPDLRILATSREPLAISGEHVYPISPLPAPTAQDNPSARKLLTFDAALLFVDRATAADHRFALTDENAPYVAEICRRLDGMPLALELAAPRLRMFSPSELLRRLDHRFGLLASGDRVAPQRQRTIRALIDWSYDLLSPQEQRLFGTLAVFSGGFTAETVTSVRRESGEDESATLELLSSLIDKSLVQREPARHSTRYRLLESTQHYARERLAERGEHAGMAARAHAVVFAALAETLERGYATMPDDEWLAQVSAEMENWRAALQWSLEERNDLAAGRRLVAALRWAWSAVSRAEGRDWTALALETVDANTPAALVARLYLAEANGLSWLHQVKACHDVAERALARLGPACDTEESAEAKWRLGNSQVALGATTEGRRSLSDALAAYRRLDHPKMTCRTLLSLSLASASLDDIASARAICAEAITIAKAHRFGLLANVVLGSLLAEFEFRAGNAEAALQLAADALAAGSAENTFSRVSHLNNMAAYLVALTRFAEARSFAREALEVSRDIRADFLTALAQQHLAAIAALRPHQSAPAAASDEMRAAHLTGYVDARLATLASVREFTELREYDLVRAHLSASLGSDRLATLLHEGAAWPEERAVAEALEI